MRHPGAANPSLYRLLVANRARHGAGVRFDTSLNFTGRGLISRMSALLHCCDLIGIEEVVTDARWYRTDRPTLLSETVVVQGERVGQPS